MEIHQCISATLSYTQLHAWERLKKDHFWSKPWVKLITENVVLVCHLCTPYILTRTFPYVMHVPTCVMNVCSHTKCMHAILYLEVGGVCWIWQVLREFTLVMFQSSQEGAVCWSHLMHMKRESDLSISWHAISQLILSQQSWIWCMLSTTFHGLCNMSNQADLSSESGSLSPIFFYFPWHPSSSTKHSILSSQTNDLSALPLFLLILVWYIFNYASSSGNYLSFFCY